MNNFHSILFNEQTPLEQIEALARPACFTDLNLDQLLSAVTAGFEEYELMQFFYLPLPDVGAAVYRQDVLRDLEDDALSGAFERFAAGMREMRARLALADKLHYALQKQEWLIEAIATYADAVERFAADLDEAEPRSEGVRELRAYVLEYAASQRFQEAASDAREVRRRLAEITYTVAVDGNRVRVDRYDGEADYGQEVAETFAKFRQGAVKDYRLDYQESAEMNHVEAQVLDLVARLYPEPFTALADCSKRHREYLDPTLRRFDRESQLYLAWRAHTERIAGAGLSFCYPQLDRGFEEAHVEDCFDLALATKLLGEDARVVVNDWRLARPERIFVVSGPNQGGKTTFARTFGQLHHLASLGLTVPGSDARLSLADRVLTHFEKQEDLAAERGKLEDDLTRVRELIEHADAHSVVVMNESFSSTALEDARYLGERVLEQLIEHETLGVYVTFVDELARLDDAIVSATSTVDADDAAVRTFKVLRKPADGKAYAMAIARKHRLTYEQLSRELAA